MLGSMKVMADRTREVIRRAAAFAEQAWAIVDRRDEIRRVLLVAAVPDAQQKTFVLEDTGSSMSMSMNMPDVLVAPGQPLEVRRQDLSTDATLDRLQAELRRAFELSGAVHPSGGRR